MAEVKMDLNELKALENKIKVLEEEKQDLKEKQKQVLVLHKYYNGRVKLTDKAKSRNFYIRDKYNAINYQGALYRDGVDISFESLVNNNIIEVDLTEDTTKISEDYINMFDAVERIRKEEVDKVSKRLEEAEQRATNAEILSSKIEDKYKKTIDDLTESYNKDIKESKDKAEKKYNKLKQEFEDFKEDKIRLSLEDELKQLKKELSEKNKFIERVNSSKFLKFFIGNYEK